jgi:hypothetical protein
MRNTFALVIGVAAVWTTLAMAADPPYIGKWKLDVARSQLTGETLSIEKLPGGGMQYHYDVEGFAYNFNLDGKEYPLPDGGTTSWAAVDAKTWQVTNRRNGKISATYRLVLDRDSIVFHSKRSKASGGTSDETSTATRVSGGPGFVGRWRITAVTNLAVGTIQIAPNGVDGVTLTSTESGAVCRAKFDGKDYPLTGPFVGTGETYVMKKTGPGSFEIVEKLNGKPLSTDKVSVSEDGRTLTFDSIAAESHDPTKAVYDRAN